MLSESDIAAGIDTIAKKLEIKCPFYGRMESLFGGRQNINPTAVDDHGGESDSETDDDDEDDDHNNNNDDNHDGDDYSLNNNSNNNVNLANHAEEQGNVFYVDFNGNEEGVENDENGNDNNQSLNMSMSSNASSILSSNDSSKRAKKNKESKDKQLKPRLSDTIISISKEAVLLR
jgi:hypothetical protein